MEVRKIGIDEWEVWMKDEWLGKIKKVGNRYQWLSTIKGQEGYTDTFLEAYVQIQEKIELKEASRDVI